MMTTTEQIEAQDRPGAPHASGSLSYRSLAMIEKLLGEDVERTAETGCGRSTILFSNRSPEHHVFCLDDTSYPDSSVTYFTDSKLARRENARLHFGPTQLTLPSFEHPGEYDCVLIDGPHGYPFPELEYFYFYPHIREGGLLIVDDLQIPTIGRMADVLQEDAMWDLTKVIGRKTAFFRRTAAKGISPHGDGWWEQDFNRRRVEYDGVTLDDGGRLQSFADRIAYTPLRRVIKKRLRSWLGRS